MSERMLPKRALIIVSGLTVLSPIFAPNFKPKTASAPILENLNVCVDLGSEIPSIPSFDFLKIQKNINNADWTNKESPTRVYIPKLNITDSLKPMWLIPTEEGGQTLSTPDEGLGTPKKPISNIIFIYGHSWWNRKQNPISQIDKLSLGDEITIENMLREKRTYSVSEFRLYNYSDPKFNLDDVPDDSLVLQTTAIIGNEWLIDEQRVKNDLWPFVPQDISDHAAFQVIAVPKK